MFRNKQTIVASSSRPTLPTNLPNPYASVNAKQGGEVGNNKERFPTFSWSALLSLSGSERARNKQRETKCERETKQSVGWEKEEGGHREVAKIHALYVNY